MTSTSTSSKSPSSSRFVPPAASYGNTTVVYWLPGDTPVRCAGIPNPVTVPVAPPPERGLTGRRGHHCFAFDGVNRPIPACLQPNEVGRDSDTYAVRAWHRGV